MSDKFPDVFAHADEVIAKAYPGEKKGYWGAQRIPNYGILRGAIVNAIIKSRQEMKAEIVKWLIKRSEETRPTSLVWSKIYKEVSAQIDKEFQL